MGRLELRAFDRRGGRPAVGLLADVILNGQQIVGRIEALHPFGMFDGHGADAIPALALVVANGGEQPHHVGNVVFLLGVVVANHADALVEHVRGHEIQAGIHAGGEFFDLPARIAPAADFQIVLVGLKDLFESCPIDRSG